VNLLHPETETDWLTVILIVAIAVGSIAVGIAVIFDQRDLTLTAVIAVATVAYSGFTWRLVQSVGADRLERQQASARAIEGTLRAALTELRHNAEREGQTHVWHTHVPFERQALDATRALQPELPIPLATALQRVELHIARYNALCRYNEVAVTAGSGAADISLRTLAQEANPFFADAISELEKHLV
jgi:hypothetical protein